MTEPTDPPLRGDAAWRAQKAAINKSNDAARERGAAERAAEDAKSRARRDEADRRESEDLPVQPTP